jgi:hypothetical protein
MWWRKHEDNKVRAMIAKLVAKERPDLSQEPLKQFVSEVMGMTADELEQSGKRSLILADMKRKKGQLTERDVLKAYLQSRTIEGGKKSNQSS